MPLYAARIWQGHIIHSSSKSQAIAALRTQTADFNDDFDIDIVELTDADTMVLRAGGTIDWYAAFQPPKGGD